MIATGFGAVVLGGLVAAVTRPLDWEYGSWVAAFLVLVCGVAQVAMGESRKRQPSARRRPSRSGWTQWGCWNSGGVAIIVGTLVARPWLVDLGSVLLFVALALALDATRTGERGDSRLWFATYRVVLLVLAISIPIGMVLSTFGTDDRAQRAIGWPRKPSLRACARSVGASQVRRRPRR